MLAAHNQNFPLLSPFLSGLFHKCSLLLGEPPGCGTADLLGWVCCQVFNREREKEGRGQGAERHCATVYWASLGCGSDALTWREKAKSNYLTEVVIDVKTHERKRGRIRESFTPVFSPSAPELSCLSPGIFLWFIHLLPKLYHLSKKMKTFTKFCSFYSVLGIHPTNILLSSQAVTHLHPALALSPCSLRL